MNAPSASAPRPPIAILGVPFDNVTTADALRLIREMIASRKPHYLATANVDFVVQALEDPELRRILLDAHLVVADGMPLVWASRWLGNPLPERVTGSGMTPLLLAEAEQHGWRVFMLGGTEQSVTQAAANTRAKHPRLEVQTYSPPFGRLVDTQKDDPMNNAEILRRLREARPDLLLVAFGCPKQERWIYAHYRQLGIPLCIGVGATIDFLAGTMRRAPVWMQRTGLEWLFRLLQEPRRLFRRYAVDFWVFGWAILSQVRQLRARRQDAAPIPPAQPPERTAAAWCLTLPARVDASVVSAHTTAWQPLPTPPASVFVEAAAVKFIDSTGVALLIQLQKAARERQCQLVIIAPSERLLESLRLMRLEEFFLQAPDRAAALRLLGDQAGGGKVLMDLASAEPAVLWQGEVTSANVADIGQLTIGRLEHARDGLVVDLSLLRFVDTSGIGLMVRLKKQAVRQGVELRFIGASDLVRRITHQLRLEEYLLGPKA